MAQTMVSAPASPQVEAVELLQATDIHKSYGGVHALRGVSLSVRPGEVHALLGENGAGKSTLTKILSGIVFADSGELFWQGKPAHIGSPSAAQALGVQTIHQELEVAPALSVLENIFLASLPSRWGLVRRVEARRRAKAVLDRLGVAIDLDTPVKALSLADRQIIEIARALIKDVKVLFMDEPTAALPPREVDRLLSAVSALRAEGVGIVYISHRLDEVLRIADRITVLRDGRKISEMPRAKADRKLLIAQILGKELTELRLERAVPVGAPLLTCRHLSDDQVINDASFEVAAGEIVGFFGLLGAGQGAVAEALFGLRACRFESCELGGAPGLPRTPREAVARGIGYVPAERKASGLALNLSIQDNILMANYGAVTRGGLIDAKLARETADRLADGYTIRRHSVAQKVSELSGGNQQKVVLAKWATRQTKLLVLDEPTRGVDVGAKAELYRILRRFADNDAACLVFSSDVEEIGAVCDRAFVVARGRTVAELAKSQLDEAHLTNAALNG